MQKRCRVAKVSERLARRERIAESRKWIKEGHHPLLSAADASDESYGLKTHTCHNPAIEGAEKEMKCQQVATASTRFLLEDIEMTDLPKSMRVSLSYPYTL
jgi:hypothetical protein